jgi:GrpB-like predicted nucleotidyltransferase (UPF0157 family)
VRLRGSSSSPGRRASVDVESLVEQHRQRITELLPGTTVLLSGSASVPGLDAKDVDLVVLVSDVVPATDRLRRLYPPLYEDEWRDDWAAFRDPSPPRVDVVATRIGTRGDDHHRRAWELLARNAELLAEYRELKADGDRYEERKAAFFERVVTLLPSDP